jgi:hypothetical protein
LGPAAYAAGAAAYVGWSSDVSWVLGRGVYPGLGIRQLCISMIPPRSATVGEAVDAAKSVLDAWAQSFERMVVVNLDPLAAETSRLLTDLIDDLEIFGSLDARI